MTVELVVCDEADLADSLHLKGQELQPLKASRTQAQAGPAQERNLFLCIFYFGRKEAGLTEGRVPG